MAGVFVIFFTSALLGVLFAFGEIVITKNATLPLSLSWFGAAAVFLIVGGQQWVKLEIITTTYLLILLTITVIWTIRIIRHYQPEQAATQQ